MIKSPAHLPPTAFVDGLPSEVYEFLNALFGVSSFPELMRVAVQLHVPLKRLKFLLPVPAPKITYPSPGGLIVAGGVQRVTITTNAPDVPHELFLIPKATPSAPVVSHAIFASPSAPLTSPFDEFINVPPDPVPGTPTEYYLEVGIDPAAVPEQQRHRILVVTPAPLAAVITGNPPPNPSPAAAYPVGTAVDFTITFSGGLPPYNYILVTGDGTNISGSAPDTTPVVHTHVYTAAGTWFPQLVYSDSLSSPIAFVPAGEYNFA